MKKLGCSLLGLSILSVVPCIVSAQAPPKVLLITREYVKAYKTGEPHEKSESLFVKAFRDAKWPTHYVGMTSLSGKSRALFFTFYDSFDAWEKDVQAQAKNATLSSALEHANAADSELLDSVDAGVFVYEPDFSLRPHYGDPHRHAMEIHSYHVRPGHFGEWAALVKLVRDAFEKAVPDAHWGCYRAQYGAPGGTYLFLTSHLAATEIDAGFEDDKKFDAALGENGLRRLGELEAASVESSGHELFVMNPKMSYVSDEYLNADADFWAPKEEPAAKPVSQKSKKTGQSQ
jgi:hypothetical protein